MKNQTAKRRKVCLNTGHNYSSTNHVKVNQITSDDDGSPEILTDVFIIYF